MWTTWSNARGWVKTFGGEKDDCDRLDLVILAKTTLCGSDACTKQLMLRGLLELGFLSSVKATHSTWRWTRVLARGVQWRQ